MAAKKKTLIELMLDAGIKPENLDERADYFVSDEPYEKGKAAVSQYSEKPIFSKALNDWHYNGYINPICITKSHPANWKSTIITKQQFIDAYNEKNKQVCKLDAVDLSAGFRDRAINKGVTNIPEDKQAEDIEPCKVVDNSAYDCTTTDDSGISLSLVDVAKSKSDGSTASYYELPEGAKELQDLISHRDMNSQVGEIFRACYRYGLVEHSDKLRDAKKIKFYADAEIKRLEKLQGSK